MHNCQIPPLPTVWVTMGDLPVLLLQGGPWQLNLSNDQFDFFRKTVMTHLAQVCSSCTSQAHLFVLSSLALTINVYSWQHYRHLWSPGLVVCGGWQ